MTFKALWDSATRLNPWRKNYTSSKKRILNSVVPFVGTKTLLFSFTHWGLTEPSMHLTNILVQDCEILTEDPNDPNFMKMAYKGVDYWFRKLDLAKQPVLTRCSCSDYYFCWAFPNYMHGLLFGPKPRTYVKKIGSNRPPRNIHGYPGCCKHLCNSALIMQTSGWAVGKYR